MKHILKSFFPIYVYKAVLPDIIQDVSSEQKV